MAVAIKSREPWTYSKISGPQQRISSNLHAVGALKDGRCKGIGQAHDSTKRSRLTQSGLLGLKLINLLNRTCATGAMPMGAPGWPELALKVAST